MAKKLSDLDKLESRLMEEPAFVNEYKASKPFAEVTMQIIRARYDAGLTQQQLAEKIGTRQSVISRIESFDYSGMNLRTLQRIAEALGLEVDIQLKRVAS
ncbi:helix-turn-helix transcriptional regulator [Vampirovibrio sp.]|uniref:helix-turn-helix transcriptional regulator n=1 Tax=Vampirovibrio sp. TaxID=2717857 RepID=UPI003593D278